jgi:hypothetical protein
MRGRVCLLYMLLALASAVLLGSESLGTRYHILLSDLRLPFRRLLRIWGSQWRSNSCSLCILGADTTENTLSNSTLLWRHMFVATKTCLSSVPSDFTIPVFSWNITILHKSSVIKIHAFDSFFLHSVHCIWSYLYLLPVLHNFYMGRHPLIYDIMIHGRCVVDPEPLSTQRNNLRQVLWLGNLLEFLLPSCLCEAKMGENTKAKRDRYKEWKQ